jgi:hypothetical protein
MFVAFVSFLEIFKRNLIRRRCEKVSSHVRRNLLTVRRNLLTVRRNLLTVRRNLLTVRRNLLTVRRNLLTVRRILLPIRFRFRDSVRSKFSHGIRSWLQKAFWRDKINKSLSK